MAQERAPRPPDLDANWKPIGEGGTQSEPTGPPELEQVPGGDWKDTATGAIGNTLAFVNEPMFEDYTHKKFMEFTEPRLSDQDSFMNWRAYARGGLGSLGETAANIATTPGVLAEYAMPWLRPVIGASQIGYGGKQFLEGDYAAGLLNMGLGVAGGGGRYASTRPGSRLNKPIPGTPELPTWMGGKGSKGQIPLPRPKGGAEPPTPKTGGPSEFGPLPEEQLPITPEITGMGGPAPDMPLYPQTTLPPGPRAPLGLPPANIPPINQLPPGQRVFRAGPPEPPSQQRGAGGRFGGIGQPPSQTTIQPRMGPGSIPPEMPRAITPAEAAQLSPGAIDVAPTPGELPGVRPPLGIERIEPSNAPVPPAPPPPAPAAPKPPDMSQRAQLIRALRMNDPNMTEVTAAQAADEYLGGGTKPPGPFPVKGSIDDPDKVIRDFLKKEDATPPEMEDIPAASKAANVVEMFRRGLKEAPDVGLTRFILPDGTGLAHNASTHYSAARELGVYLEEALQSGVIRFEGYSGSNAEIGAPITWEQAQFIADAGRANADTVMVDVVDGKGNRDYRMFEGRQVNESAIRNWVNNFFQKKPPDVKGMARGSENELDRIAKEIIARRKQQPDFDAIARDIIARRNVPPPRVPRPTPPLRNTPDPAGSYDPLGFEYQPSLPGMPPRADLPGRALPAEPPIPANETISQRVNRVMGGLPGQIAGASKTLWSTGDVSAAFRQALPLIHRPEYWKNFANLFKAAGEDHYRILMDSIEGDEYFEHAMQAGLKLTDLGKVHGREEAFLSALPEKIPVFGKIVKMSARSFTGFLDKVRFDTYKSLVKQAQGMGLDISENAGPSQQIANYVNNATGRGSIQFLERNANVMNALFFSPRLMYSRMQMLNPANYIWKGDPFVRQQYLKSMAATVGAWWGIATAAKAFWPDQVEVVTNPQSSDFGKIKIGNTRIDPAGGFQQYLVAFSKLKPEMMAVPGLEDPSETGNLPRDLATNFLSRPGGFSTSSIDQQEESLTSGKYGGTTRKDVIERFGANKLSPLGQFAYNMAIGHEMGTRTPIQPSAEVMDLFIPLIMQDAWEIYQQDPALLGLMVPAAFGMGVQSYEKGTTGSPSLGKSAMAWVGEQ